MTELCELAFKHNTDKSGSYSTLYDSLLRGRRSEIKKVLEIGIGTLDAMKHVPGYKVGASLYMWRDYLPHATIYGLDIDPDVLITDTRILTRQCDQGNVDDLIKAANWAGGNFDLIVDDGSHMIDHQVLTAHTLIPFLAPGGLYIIEDVNCPDEVSSQLNCEHAVISYKYTPTLTGRLILIRKD